MAKLMDRARQELVGINKFNSVGNSEVAFIAEELDARTGGDKTGERQVFIETEARARPECAHLLALWWRQVRVHGGFRAGGGVFSRSRPAPRRGLCFCTQ